ncbi:MAG: endonuclease [Clostridium sp.]|nr:endonuclease [Clostridium sp.]
MKLKLLFTAAVAAASLAGHASAPDGYYDRCENLYGNNLIKALCSAVSPHNVVSYDGLYDLYRTSDIRPEDNTLWDMYSTKHWSFSSKCGNYSGVGSCYNREHSFPKSWFGGKVSPMYSDAFHLYPTDGQVNGYRGNYPYGECAGGKTWSNGSVKALGRLGASTFPGYSGTVFEPDDQYKGDFARSYFYMAACYNDRIASWDSPMLAGNSYPAFDDWAIEMLLKWHRQDPVSQKELDRNEAVYAAQNNRNPFIDHPELAEHIWGNKKTTPWRPAGSDNPAIKHPADGLSVDLGMTAAGHTLSADIELRTTAISDNVTLSVSGNAFGCSPASIPATTANEGTNIRVTFCADRAGAYSGTLTVTAGTLTSRVSLAAEAVDGLPVFDASEVTDHSFAIRWINIDGPDARYNIDVTRSGRSIDGYPATVAAAAGTHTVEGLEADATYEFRVSSPTLTSRTVSVTTAEPTPMIRFLYDADLDFATLVGEPSEIAEVLLDIDNIAEDILLLVDEPFQLSGDRTTWAEELTLVPGEDRFYLRLYSDTPGTYSTAIEARAGNYYSDEVVVDGVVKSTIFCETFENPMSEGVNSYAKGFYDGTAATWEFESANIFEDDMKFNGSNSMRFKGSNSGAGRIAMTEDKRGGLGTLSFDLRKWDNRSDGEAVVVAEYSTDGGATWLEAGVGRSATAEFSTQSFVVNATGNIRLRLRQTGGNRFNLDNITMTDYSGASASNSLPYHRWDAFCSGGCLVIATGDSPVRAAVYGLDGTTWFDGTIEGRRQFDLPAGLYIVVVDDFARRVVVK